MPDWFGSFAIAETAAEIRSKKKQGGASGSGTDGKSGNENKIKDGENRKPGIGSQNQRNRAPAWEKIPMQVFSVILNIVKLNTVKAQEESR